MQKKIMENIKVIDDWLETAQLICTKTDGKQNITLTNLRRL